MQFIKDNININFIGNRKNAFFISAALIVLTVVLLFYRGGLNLGVDFTGGIVINVKMGHTHTLDDIRAALPDSIKDSIIQQFGELEDHEYLVRVQNPELATDGLGDKVKAALADKFGDSAEIRSFDMVGPKVGDDLREKAMFAIFFSILIIVIYISWRFELKLLMSVIMAGSLGLVVYIGTEVIGISIPWLTIVALLVTIILCWILKLKYAMGAIIALIHDVIITVGAFALTDREISLAIVAALLTIVGYSLNDTIVVFDRIRENVNRFRKRSTGEVINSSINETLSRTILTSVTTLLVVVALFVFGGGVIHDFAFAMLIGVLVGTYSSIFVASPVLLAWAGKENKE